MKPRCSILSPPDSCYSTEKAVSEKHLSLTKPQLLLENCELNMAESVCSYFITLSGSTGQAIENSRIRYKLIPSEEVLIGRAETCQIVLDSEQYPIVSRCHAKIQSLVDGSQISWQICDLNAANGTYFNFQRLQGCKTLQSGDRFMLGKGGPEFQFSCEIASIIATESPKSVQSSSTPETVTPPLPSPTVPITEQVVVTTPKREEISPRSLWNLVNETKFTILLGHDDLVKTVAFSPDGNSLASGSADKTIKIWNLALEQESQTLTGHKLAIGAVAFSPDGKCLASGSADKSIKIWNLASAQEVQQFTGHTMGITALGFSPDGKCLASGSGDKTIKIWQTTSGDVIQNMAGHKMGINAVVFSRDNQLLASGGADRTVKLWQVASGAELSTLPVFRSPINSLFFSPDGKILAIFTDDKLIRLWHWQEAEEIGIFPGYNWQIGDLAISPNGQKLASGSEDKAVKIWSIAIDR